MTKTFPLFFSIPLIFFAAIVCGCPSTPPHVKQARQVDKALKQGIPVEEQLTEPQRLWLLGLSALFAELNEAQTDQLYLYPDTRANRKKAADILERNWGVLSRESFMEKVDLLLEEGDSRAFLQLQPVVEAPDFDYYKVMGSGDFSDQEMKRLWFLSQRDEVVLPPYNALRGWDASRAALLCRYAVQAGYIDRDEAWRQLMRIGEAVQRRFNSWAEFGYNAALGRGFWLAPFGNAEGAYQEMLSLMAVLSVPGGAWHGLPWEVSL